MTRHELMDLIHGVPKGFRVSFEIKEGSILRSECFPSDGLIPHEEIAWHWAKIIADAAPGKLVNIYVVDYNHIPVPGYESRKIENG